MSDIWKVIKIIDDYRIVINGGKNDSLQREDELEIFIKGEEVRDPETNEPLGTLDKIKARLVVVDLFDQMAVCKSAETFMHDMLNPIANFQTYKTSRLKVDPKQISGPTKEYDDIIRIGDLVRRV